MRHGGDIVREREMALFFVGRTPNRCSRHVTTNSSNVIAVSERYARLRGAVSAAGSALTQRRLLVANR